MFNIFSSETKAYKNLSGKEFKEELKKSNGILLDVRTPGEYAAGTINGSRNMDMMSSNFKASVNNLDKNKEYFLFCRSGNRSAQACSMMAKDGFKVYNLKGGIGEWPG